jgi:hypothetical protein
MIRSQGRFGKSLVRLSGIALSVLLVGGSAFPDVLTLKTGEKIQCTYLGGTARIVRAEVAGIIKAYDVAQVANISFLDGESSAPATTKAVPPPATKIIMPTGTPITVRAVDPIDSSTPYLGKIFAGATDEPVQVNGTEVIPKDSAVQMRIVSNLKSGGQVSLTIVLSTITINGKVVPVSSSDVRASASTAGPNQEVQRIGSGTSALSGIAGALGVNRTLATGGSAAGELVNVGNQLAVEGPKVKISPGTRLVFRTQSQVSF